ncbi:hypothetical protein [Streptosporangium sp. NPDC004631]
MRIPGGFSTAPTALSGCEPHRRHGHRGRGENDAAVVAADLAGLVRRLAGRDDNLVHRPEFVHGGRFAAVVGCPAASAREWRKL